MKLKLEEIQEVLAKSFPNAYEVRIVFKSEVPLTLEQAQAVVMAAIKKDKLDDEVFTVYTVPRRFV